MKGKPAGGLTYDRKLVFSPRHKSVLRLLKWFVALAVVQAVLVVAVGLYWLNRPLPLRLTTEPVLDVSIPAGTSARGVAQALVRSGVDTPEWMLYAWFRFSGEARAIKAGSYELPPETTPRSLLSMLVNGVQAVRRVTLVEGWNHRQVLQALQQAEHLRYDLPQSVSPTELMPALGLKAPHPEGRFFPDTYVYPKHATASSVLRQAAAAMDQRLADAWAQRQPGLPLRNPEEALILASIVEKETGAAQDRAMVAGVFVNRLRIGMRLQTDPTVIYGVGEGFEGRLRRRHLDTDTPYNTYTRAGLPPTPIAMPGWASLLAAVQPAATPAMYFVSRGDGTSQFSRTLQEHNEAVRRFILNR